MSLLETVGLWVLAAVFLALGVWALVRRRRALGMAFVIGALLIGPGGELILHGR